MEAHKRDASSRRWYIWYPTNIIKRMIYWETMPEPLGAIHRLLLKGDCRVRKPFVRGQTTRSMY